MVMMGVMKSRLPAIAIARAFAQRSSHCCCSVVALTFTVMVRLADEPLLAALPPAPDTDAARAQAEQAILALDAATATGAAWEALEQLMAGFVREVGGGGGRNKAGPLDKLGAFFRD